MQCISPSISNALRKYLYLGLLRIRLESLRILWILSYCWPSPLIRCFFGFSSEEDKASLIEPESRTSEILLDRENEARQKSRATWLLCGDDNTHFFHKYVNHRKNVNSI